MFELNNKKIALNIWNTKKLRLAYISKYNFKRENQVILFMMTDGKKMALSYWEKFICIT